jgi:hypothetical protein
MLPSLAIGSVGTVTAALSQAAEVKKFELSWSE